MNDYFLAVSLFHQGNEYFVDVAVGDSVIVAWDKGPAGFFEYCDDLHFQVFG